MGYQGFPQKQQIQEVVLQTLGGGPESIHVESMVKAPKKRQNFSLNFVAYKVSPCGGHAGDCHLSTRRIFLILLLKQHTPHGTYTPTKNEALPLQNDPVAIENSSSFLEMTSGKRIDISKIASNICFTFFHLIFDCSKANFRPLLKGQPHLHRKIITSFLSISDLKVTISVLTSPFFESTMFPMY